MVTVDGGYAELLGEVERCELRLAETRRRFVYSEGETEFAYNAGAERSEHTELVKLEAELRHVADRLRHVADHLHELHRPHHREPTAHAGHA